MNIFGIPIWVIIPFVLGFIIFWLAFESLALRKKLEGKIRQEYNKEYEGLRKEIEKLKIEVRRISKKKKKASYIC